MAFNECSRKVVTFHIKMSEQSTSGKGKYCSLLCLLIDLTIPDGLLYKAIIGNDSHE